jgi:simple sugar transport system permease protein
MFGVLIQGIIQTLIIFQGNLSSWWTKVAVAALLCLFVVLQRIIESRGEKLKQAKAPKKQTVVSK